MGGDDSQKLLPCRGSYSPPGRKPPAQLRINNVTETAGWNLARGTPSFWPGLSYRPPGSLLESRGGSILPRAEVLPEIGVHGRATGFVTFHAATARVFFQVWHPLVSPKYSARIGNTSSPCLASPAAMFRRF